MPTSLYSCEILRIHKFVRRRLAILAIILRRMAIIPFSLAIIRFLALVIFFVSDDPLG
jgi:hypothetical protein